MSLRPPRPRFRPSTVGGPSACIVHRSPRDAAHPIGGPSRGSVPRGRPSRPPVLPADPAGE